MSTYNPNAHKDNNRNDLTEAHQQYRDMEIDGAVHKIITSQGGERRANPEYLKEIASALYKSAQAIEAKRNG